VQEFIFDVSPGPSRTTSLVDAVSETVSTGPEEKKKQKHVGRKLSFQFAKTAVMQRAERARKRSLTTKVWQSGQCLL